LQRERERVYSGHLSCFKPLEILMSESNPQPTNRSGISLWLRSRRGRITIISVVGGIVAIGLGLALVFNLVIIPNQRAEAERIRLEQEHEAAVQEFEEASKDCNKTNVLLSTSIEQAETAAATDSAELLKPDLLYDLNVKLTAARALPPCAVPALETETEAIVGQTTAMKASVQSLEKSVSELDSGVKNVATSKKAKVDAEAAAKKAEEAAKIAEQQKEAKQKYDQEHIHVFTQTDSQGHKREYTVETSNWIAGSNSSQLETTWKQFGGKDAMPLTTGGYSRGPYLGTATLDQSKAAYLIGKVSVRNATPDYPAADFLAQAPILSASYLYGQDRHSWSANSSVSSWSINPNMGMVSCVEYDNKTDCSAPDSGNIYNFVNPSMTTNSWGPVAFVIALGEATAKTPNEPNGPPEFDTVELEFDKMFGTLEGNYGPFSPDKTW
jgi:hypothetical protein